MPTVLGCRSTEMMGLVKFLTHGLRFYLIRDDRGDFVFLSLSSLESAVAAVRADRARELARGCARRWTASAACRSRSSRRASSMPPGYSIAARYEPAQMSVVGDQPVVMAGGDYYNVFRPDERTLVVLIGDASGHGLKACMSIMAMHTLIRMLGGDRYRDTAAFVTEINERLCENSIVQGGGGFITLFYAAIDTQTHVMHWTTAGHPLPLLALAGWQRGTADRRRIGRRHALGRGRGGTLRRRRLTLPLNSRVLLYTDGLADSFPMNTTQGDGGFRRERHLRGVEGQSRPPDGRRRSPICSRSRTPSRWGPGASMTRRWFWSSGRSDGNSNYNRWGEKARQ